jgi:hypothetical protein
VRHLDIGGDRQQHAHQVGHVADAERAVVDLAGMRLGPLDQILDRLDPGSGIGHGAQRVGGGLGDWDEVAERVVGQLLVDEAVRRDRAHRSIDQRVAVGLGLGAGLHSNDGVGARAIVHDALLAPEIGHLLREERACRSTPEPAAWHDDTDGTVGKIVGRLRGGAGGDREHRHARQRGKCK